MLTTKLRARLPKLVPKFRYYNEFLSPTGPGQKEVRHAGEVDIRDILKPSQACPKIDPSICVEAVEQNEARPAYLDNNSTTPLDPRVLDKMLPYMVSLYGNPHSRTHLFGWETENAVENSRKDLGELINAKRPEKDIIFTSGATESNNIAIKGVVNHLMAQKESQGDASPVHIITSQIDHKCVLASCRDLERNNPGKVRVTYLPVNNSGMICLEELERSIVPGQTALVSIIGVHNEIGTIQPLKEIGNVCKKHKLVFHSDLAQAVGKIPIDVEDLGIHLASISGHKMYGPKGVGALYISSTRRPRIRVQPPMSGGGQERGIRSGTVPSYLCVGLGEAARICSEEMQNDHDWIKKLSDLIYHSLTEKLEGITLNGDLTQRYLGNLNLSFQGIEGESLIMSLNKICAISSGSACTSASLEPSYVLRAIGVGDDLAHTSLRFDSPP